MGLFDDFVSFFSPAKQTGFGTPTIGNPFKGGPPSTPPLTKEAVKRGDMAAAAVVLAALGGDAAFEELAAAEAAAGRGLVAQKLVEGFKLAVPDPTEEEIKVSLASTLTTVVAGAPPAAAAAAPAPPAKPSGGKALTKSLVLQKDPATDKAIIAALGTDDNFGALARVEGAVLLGRWKAARKVAENFKLAAPSPSKAELMVSLGSTAAKLAAEARLPPPKPLTKSLLKQAALKDALKDAGDTKQAVAAVVALFVASASRPFHAVALAAVEEELAATAEAYAAYQKEPVAKAAARKAARKLASSFKLASKSPTADEVLVSLRSTLVSLTNAL